MDFDKVQPAVECCPAAPLSHRLCVRCRPQVVVMDAGRVIEAGSPRELLASPLSAFTALVNAAGEEAAAHLRTLVQSESAVTADATAAAGAGAGAATLPS